MPRISRCEPKIAQTTKVLKTFVVSTENKIEPKLKRQKQFAVRKIIDNFA